MGFGKESEKKRAEALKLKELRKAEDDYLKLQAEKAAYESGAEKTGGFLGFGGSYAAKEKDMSTSQKVALGMQLGSSLGIIPGSRGGSQSTSTSEGAIGGALEGGMSAAIASGGNPYAAAAGAIIGGITGGMKARAARKAILGEIEAERIKAEANALSEGERLKSEAMQRMGLAIQNSLLRR